MSDIRVGDKVRVTREFVVHDISAYGTVFVAGELRGYEPTDHTIEIIERRQPQVGDTIQGPDAFDALPNGSVVQGAGCGPIFKIDGKWLNRQGAWVGPAVHSPRELVFLP